jgi:hypothetical protein
VWCEVVGCQPGGWLTKAQAPLLVAYCRHVVRAQFLAERVNKFKPEWLAEEGALERLDKLLNMSDRESRALNAFARSLRLTPQSQYGPRKGATINASASDGPRPWDS